MRLGLRPNHVTVAGMLLTVGVGVALAAGKEHWRTWGIGLMIGAGACDLLDGAMAKLGHLRTRFGAVLDSSCDRVGDAALYLGPAFYFILQPDPRPNLTLIFLAFAGLVWAYLISYIRSRAENEGVDGRGGFWQRPERVVTLLVGMVFLHMTTALWILGTLPLATVAHRLGRVRRSCRAADAGATPPVKVEDWPTGLLAGVLWRWPRGTLAFDLMAGAVIATVACWDLPAIDPLREAVARLFGA
jgi:CDP-diacylglycerol--glycerol-3-phosphate 3-phosphatidyltransferase